MMNKLINLVEPQPFQVYQRQQDDTAAIRIRGEVQHDTPVRIEARIAGNTATSSWQELEIANQSFAGELDRVPVGGPYRVEIRASDGKETVTIAVPEVLVGDLWILAGQSNMDGCGKLINLEAPSRYVRCYYYNETWGIAKDPLCRLIDSIDPVHWPVGMEDASARAEASKRERAFNDHGAGLGVRFGKDLYKATGVPVGLIICSHGGTSMRQWSPKLKNLGGNSLYGSMMRRVNAVGGKVAGCLWYQGESDAIGQGVETYKRDTIEFIETLRKDLGCPNLPFIYVQLGPVLYNAFGIGDSALVDAWNKVQADQLAIESEVPNTAMTAAVDATNSDFIHLDSVSLRRIGARMAKLARKLVFGHDFQVGPRPRKVEFLDENRTKLRINFDEVNGKLIPARGIRGFLIEKDGSRFEITNCSRGPDGTSVIIDLASPVPRGARLWHGRGIIPTCNLTDQLGFPAPVFGPITLPD